MNIGQHKNLKIKADTPQRSVSARPVYILLIEQISKGIRAADRADGASAGNASHKEDGAADQSDQGQHETGRLHTADKTSLLGIAGQDQTNNTQMTDTKAE